MNGSLRLVCGTFLLSLTGFGLAMAQDDSPGKKKQGKLDAGGMGEMLFKRLDANNDSKISLEEFKKLSEMRERLAEKGGPDRDKLLEKLREKGIDPDKFKEKMKEKGLDPEKLKALREAKGAGAQLKPEDLFKKLDKNNNGYLEKEELQSMREMLGGKLGQGGTKK